MRVSICHPMVVEGQPIKVSIFGREQGWCNIWSLKWNCWTSCVESSHWRPWRWTVIYRIV